jgi:hypothetical protein
MRASYCKLETLVSYVLLHPGNPFRRVRCGVVHPGSDPLEDLLPIILSVKEFDHDKKVCTICFDTARCNGSCQLRWCSLQIAESDEVQTCTIWTSQDGNLSVRIGALASSGSANVSLQLFRGEAFDSILASVEVNESGRQKTIEHEGEHGLFSAIVTLTGTAGEGTIGFANVYVSTDYVPFSLDCMVNQSVAALGTTELNPVISNSDGDNLAVVVDEYNVYLVSHKGGNPIITYESKAKPRKIGEIVTLSSSEASTQVAVTFCGGGSFDVKQIKIEGASA